MRTKRLYRAVAYYDDWTAIRHFQSRRARDSWAAQRLEGYPSDGFDGFNERPAIPPAIKVIKSESNPITWPEEEV